MFPNCVGARELPEEVLEEIESDPGFQRIMAVSDHAEREGRTIPHDEVRRAPRGGTKAIPPHALQIVNAAPPDSVVRCRPNLSLPAPFVVAHLQLGTLPFKPRNFGKRNPPVTTFCEVRQPRPNHSRKAGEPSLC